MMTGARKEETGRACSSGSRVRIFADDSAMTRKTTAAGEIGQESVSAAGSIARMASTTIADAALASQQAVDGLFTQ